MDPRSRGVRRDVRERFMAIAQRVTESIAAEKSAVHGERRAPCTASAARRVSGHPILSHRGRGS